MLSRSLALSPSSQLCSLPSRALWRSRKLEEDQAALQSLLASRFAEGVRKEALAWEARLAHLSETLDEWVACQRGWMYLVDTSPPRP